MQRAGALALAALALFFIAAIGLFAYAFACSGTLVGYALAAGLALLIVPLTWTIIREVRFGAQTAALAREVRRDPRPLDLEDFDLARAHAESHPEEWRAWYRLALSYDHHRDRRQARAAMRTALRLHAASRRP